MEKMAEVKTAEMITLKRGPRAPVAKWVKRWPADLPPLRSVPGGRKFSLMNGAPLSPSHHPDMTGILLTRT